MRKFFILYIALMVMVSCRPEPFVSLGVQSLEVSKDGETCTVSVNSAYNWTVTAEGAEDWITVTKTSRKEASVTISPNETLDARVAKCRFDGKGALAFLTISQEAPKILELNEDPINFDGEAGKAELTITTNIQLQATCNDSWVSLTMEEIHHGYLLTVMTEPNYSVNDRSSKIKISGTNRSRTIKILQKGYTSSDYSQDKKVKVWQKTDTGRGGNFVILGDGFSDRMIADGTYDSIMSKAAEALFVQEPYTSLRDKLNVYSVNVVSPNEGIGDGGKTALGTYFYGDRMAYGDINKCFDYALLAVDGNSMDNTVIIVVMNSSQYAGVAQWFYPDKADDYGGGLCMAFFAMSTNDKTFSDLVQHEACGHGFAKLADEYESYNPGDDKTAVYEQISQEYNQYARMGWYKNVDYRSDISSVKWSKFILDQRYDGEKIGVYEGAGYYTHGAYRPTPNSLMRTLESRYNAPSREAIYYRINKLYYGADWEYDRETFVQQDLKNISALMAAPTCSDSSSTKLQPCPPPVILQMTWREARSLKAF